MDIHDYINRHFSKYDFDIRKSKYARFSDQKCTPDMVTFIADCVENMAATKPIFTINDIWNSQYFIRNTRAFFSKPWANDVKAENEYDKVIAQPLNLLAYAHVIEEAPKTSKAKKYFVKDETILDHIARRDYNAYEFLLIYFTKVLEDSDFYKYFEEYLLNCEDNLTNARAEIYHRFHKLIDGNTPTHSELDIKRIFHKIFNVLACENGVPGSKGKYSMMYSDLMYNRTNMRDVHKPKQISRQEYFDIIRAEKKEDDKEKESYINNYYIQKAINQVRKLETSSEVHDTWGNGEATQVHHIFPKHKYPNLSATVENLIKLTATQHYTKAHPSNKTKEVDYDYQRVCLLAKADSIASSIKEHGETYYRKASFINVINEGYGIDLSTKLTFNQIQEEIKSQYRIIINKPFSTGIVAEPN